VSQLERELEHAGDSDQALAVSVINVDRMENLNAARGRRTGNRALEKLGEWLHEETDEQITVGRNKGDEYALLLRGEDVKDLVQKTEDLRKHIVFASNKWMEELDGITVSMGLCHVDSASSDATAEAVAEQAERCVDVAKNDGRNCLRYCGVEDGNS
jgi:diguanylate cyclase (GGDEF)-like protein